MLKLILFSILGGVVTWGCGHGIEYIFGNDIATSLQFRFFIGVTVAFALGGGVLLKDSKVGLTPNHNYYIALFALPGLLFAAPLFLFSPDWQGLSVVAIIWGICAGGCSHLLQKMFIR